MKIILAGMVALAVTACGSTSAATPTAPVTKTVTKTVTVTKTPKSCLVAIAAAEKVYGHTGEFVMTASRMPPLIGKAYHAGLVMDNAEAQQVIDKVNTLSNEVKTETTKITADRGTFDRNAALCRAGK